MERVLAALTRLETRIDTIERATAFAGSDFRRAIDGGSALGRTPMQIDELPAALEAQAADQAQAEYQAQAHHQQAPPPTPYADPGCLPGLNGHRVPNARDLTLMIGKFSGVEQYKGLGSEFCQRALLFIEAIKMPELGCGYKWTERVKANKLQKHLEGTSLKYYQAHIEGWWMRNQSIAYLLEQLWLAFKVNISHHQAVHMYGSKKSSSRTWTEHLLYLTALMHSSETSDKMVLESVVNYAAPHMKVAIMGRYDPGRTDYLHHAQEILAWAQEIEDDDRPIRNHVKGVVNAVGESRKCFTCGKPGHIARDAWGRYGVGSLNFGQRCK
ncbi:unnamed protein product [Peronospora farinosa]|uniref:CCHC-type domain-containing protein n=1 Tax=Peronospora farinosa TaxID=134698 RepID=A0AAV0U002_9STRA|nr:unnamed protein product [Peronospora farinosa]